MIELEILVRNGLDDLADEVRPVDLRARVASARRRRRSRIRLVSFGVAAAVAASAVGAVALWPETGGHKPDLANQTDSWLPAEIDLTTATPVSADASLRLVVQTTNRDWVRQSYGIVTGSNEVVALPNIPDLGPWRTSLTADGSLALFQDFDLEVPVQGLVDTRTGVAVPVDWPVDYQAAGMAPDGRSLAIVTLTPMDPEANPPQTAPWGLTFVDVETGDSRSVVLPESLDLVGVSSDALALAPVWSPDGAWVALTVTSHSALKTAVVAVDGTDAWIAGNAPFGGAPWSPDGDRLLIQSEANGFRVIVADPATGTPGEIVASGATHGRDPLGWSADDRLLWFDTDLDALVETDLRGATLRTVSLTADLPIADVLLAPSIRP